LTWTVKVLKRFSCKIPTNCKVSRRKPLVIVVRFEYNYLA
jgi:hypothetical protein